MRSRHTRGGAPGDRDLDGIPDALDVDDDGDLVLDDVDASAGTPAALRGTTPPVSEFRIGTVLTPSSGVATSSAVNVNAGSTDAEIEASFSTGTGRLFVEVVPFPGSTGPPDSTELDCGGVADPSYAEGWSGGFAYCTRGGVGRAYQPGVPIVDLERFPECCDADGDGLGTLIPGIGGGGGPRS